VRIPLRREFPYQGQEKTKCCGTNHERLTELDEIPAPLLAFGPEDGLLLLGEPLLLATDEITERRHNGIPSGLNIQVECRGSNTAKRCSQWPG